MSLALVAFLPQLEEQRANLHRQHVCCILHKSPGWRVLQSRFHAGCKPPMGGLSFTFHQSSAHSRSSKPRSGHAFEEWNSSGGVETSSRLSSNNLALPAALLAVSCPADGGCSDIALTKSQTSRVPSSEYFASGVMQNQGGESVGDLHCPELVESALVSRSEGDPDLAPPWRIPLRRDLLSQVNGAIWHPSPELWSLHVWLLQGP